MAWLRARARLTGMVALLALALQIVSSYGHFHREWVTGAAHSHVAHNHGAHDHGAHGHHDHAHDEAFPAFEAAPDRDHDHQPGHRPDGCAVCTAASLAQAFAPPAAATLIERRLIDIVQTAVVAEAPTPDLRHSPFQSRAPPQS